jgi:hypothetical protein
MPTSKNWLKEGKERIGEIWELTLLHIGEQYKEWRYFITQHILINPLYFYHYSLLMYENS